MIETCIQGFYINSNDVTRSFFMLKNFFFFLIQILIPKKIVYHANWVENRNYQRFLSDHDGHRESNHTFGYTYKFCSKLDLETQQS